MCEWTKPAVATMAKCSTIWKDKLHGDAVADVSANCSFSPNPKDKISRSIHIKAIVLPHPKKGVSQSDL
jgi:hypothetical protein